MHARRKIAVLLCALTGFLTPQSALAADPLSTAAIFQRLIPSSTLADPSTVVMDLHSGEIIYANNAYTGRKPASVIKLISATAAYTYLNPSESYTTSLWTGIDNKSVVIQGSLDPWISFDHKVAEKMGRTSLERIEFNALSTLKDINAGSTKNTTIYYSNLYSQEVTHIQKFIRAHGGAITLKRITAIDAPAKANTHVLTSHSPTLQTILEWTLTWSDNLLAERIARLASVAAGHTLDDEGIAVTFREMLTNLNINTDNMIIKDASGLSRDNRVTAIQMAQLLKAIRDNQLYAPLITGLPVGGKTGTLRKRFIDTAPNAIGLVKAKTGTLNGTANLAGYIESGEREYIFVIIADNLKRNYTAEKLARATVDRILGKIAAPLLPQLLPTDTRTAGN
jgi:D-alanyl-D-alanine carboxypeptidase